jgi:hypothetical protein
MYIDIEYTVKIHIQYNVWYSGKEERSKESAAGLLLLCFVLLLFDGSLAEMVPRILGFVWTIFLSSGAPVL